MRASWRCRVGQWDRWRETLLDPRNLKRIAWACVVLGVLLVGVWGVQVLRAAWSLQARLNEVEALIEGDPLETLKAEPQRFETLLYALRRDVVTLRSARGLTPLGRAFGWLPKVGPLLAQATPLLDLADGLSEAGVLAWTGYRPLLEDWQAGRLSIEGLAVRMTAGTPYAVAAQRPAQRALAARQQLDVAALPYRFQGPLTQLDALLPLLADGLMLAEHAPDLLGMAGPRTYLILALNEDELRPGGGFITAVGEVRLESGRIVGLEFRDSYAVDDFSQPYPSPPEPLQRFMGVQLWVFRDSNWSPDFPTAMRDGLPLYRPQHAPTVDGVIALDQRAVRRLVGAFSPLTVTGVEEPVTEANIVAFMQASWAPDDGVLDREWWQQRKSFMGDLAAAVLARVERGDVNWPQLLRELMAVLNQKHIQVYLEGSAAAVLRQRGWDGALREPAGDLLLLAEANVGYNKVTPRIRRSAQYGVDLSLAPPRAQLQVTYTHTGKVPYPCTPEVRYDPVYEAMMNRCYWAYVQVFAPAGITLLEASRHPIAAEAVWTREAWDGAPIVTSVADGYTRVEQAFLLAPGETTTLALDYELPVSVLRREGQRVTYRLDFQKQAGLAELPFEITLRLPENAVLWSAQPAPTATTGNVLLFKGLMVQDLDFRVQYLEGERASP